MTETKHTKGPWEVGRGGILNEHGEALFVTGEDGTVWWQNAADPYLMAAAPDALKALELHIAYEALPVDRGGKNGPKGRALAAYTAARDAAIAKARGK